MANSFRRGIPLLMATVFGTGVLGMTGVSSYAQAQEPPARVARLAFEQGTVSFHDADDTAWSPAQINDTLTTGDSLWTEPNSRSELSVAGTRVRMDQSTQLDMLQIDDSRTQLQLARGRLDIKTFTMDTAQPYEVVTPRGVVKLQAQGDYYVEAGTIDDPTRLGVRSGAAQITGANGQVLAVRAGEVGEITGDAMTPQLHTIQSAPPPQPSYWAQRDQQISYAAPQYLSADVVGYEDMQAYGSWSNDPEYGQVWSPNSVPSGWQPYSTGSWAYSQPYGWTWVDEQPWGYAPYHYGRWAHRNDRWYWVPPERRERAVYAPALVAFVAGAALGSALGNANTHPVGWFPLGPREAYVPPYSNDRNYYNRVNANARVERAILDDRWQRAERHEAIRADQQNERMANRRFTTVVPAQAFVNSQKVSSAAIKVAPEKLTAAPVVAVSAPPAPEQGNVAKANTRFNGVQELARPPQAERQDHRPAPGPKIATQTQPPAAGGKPNQPNLQPRNGAPPPPAIQGERTPNQAPNAQQPNRPGEPNRPNEANRAEPPKPGEVNKPAQPAAPQANRPEPAKPGEAPKPNEARKPGEPAKAGEAPKPGEAPRPPQAQQQHAPQPPQAQQAPKPAENHAAPAAPQQKVAEPPRAPEQHQAQQPQRAPEQRAPERPAERPATPQPPHQAEAPRAPAPQPQQQHAAPPPQAQPQHVQTPPPPQHAAPPPQAQQHAPAPAPQQHAAPPPQAQQHAAPPPQAPHPAAAPAPKPAAPPQQAQQKEKEEKK